MVSALSPSGIRRIVLEQSRRANVGHIGSCLCVVEILCALYDHVLRIPHPGHPDRDRVVLSKGHAALALYAVLAAKGWLSSDDLLTFCGDDTKLAVHPEINVPGIDFSTGSLGHGLGLAAGAALAARLHNSQRRAFCLLSDGECNEGSIWETAMFAAHHRLANLRAVVDCNGQQALGLTADVCDSSNLVDRWRAFGWHAVEVEGHSIEQLTAALNANNGRPTAIIAKTIFGKGVSYMERGDSITRKGIPANPVNWHYLPMTDEEYKIAMDEVAAQQ